VKNKKKKKEEKKRNKTPAGKKAKSFRPVKINIKNGIVGRGARVGRKEPVGARVFVSR